MNKNAEHYYRSAINLFLKAVPVAEIDGFEFYIGKKKYFNRGVINCFNDHCSVSIARDKFASNKILERAGLPVPKATFISRQYFEEGSLEELIFGLTFPLVIKPTLDGRRGRAVLCNIQTMEQLRTYLAAYFLHDDYISIEEFHGNLKSYRILILGNKLLGVVERFPAHVVGDGTHNLQELIDLKNQERQQLSDILEPIMFDDELYIRLNELGITLDYIPAKNESITLCYVCNSSRGGTYKPLGQTICKENIKLLIKAAKALKLNLVGFDVQCKDINLPIESTVGVIIEANANPSVRIHEQATNGTPHNVTKAILRSLIYRHPFSYLYGLYKNKCTSFYIRSMMFTLILVLGTALAYLLAP
ncbi:UDP-N-acetylmuramyl peptide synthase [uncultured Legionella sp.]|uniref:UDP-N-acetylmuramyl peptide synthase n=1 Tax=uncultured Legionella sp. TaxID=210934 RepID=UPI0026223EB8|nr:UDP-N-acetylmuramyl peptide synthase [uncultured Legionella sp.]